MPVGHALFGAVLRFWGVDQNPLEAGGVRCWAQTHQFSQIPGLCFPKLTDKISSLVDALTNRQSPEACGLPAWRGLGKGEGTAGMGGADTPPTPAQMQPRPAAAVLLIEFLPVSVFEF